MLDVTQRFLEAMVESHRVSVAATIIPPGGDPPPAAAEVIDGTVSMDRDARTRRQGSVTVAWALDANVDYVRQLPYGGYVQLYRGVLYADGTYERPLLATLRVENLSWSRAEGQVTIELADRMQQVQDEPFPTPWNAAGLKPTDAIVQAVHDVFDDEIAYNVTTDPDSETELADAVYDSDRGQAISDLASSIGAEAFFDAAGDFVLRPSPPDPSTVEPVWTFAIGAGGTLEEVQENLDRSEVRNGVAVRGQGDPDTPPIYSLAVDDDPESPTYWGGPFGKVALIVNLTSVQDQAQCDATAASLLNLRLGLARTVTLQGVPMPAVEPDDVILACYPDGRQEPMLVNAATMPLAPTASMQLTVTGHYRPTLTSSRRTARRAFKVFGGAQAWRELRDAKLVSA